MMLRQMRKGIKSVKSVKSVSRETGLSRVTVKRYLKA